MVTDEPHPASDTTSAAARAASSADRRGLESAARCAAARPSATRVSLVPDEGRHDIRAIHLDMDGRPTRTVVTGDAAFPHWAGTHRMSLVKMADAHYMCRAAAQDTSATMQRW